MSLLEKVKKLVDFNAALKQQLAETEAKLAEALANDKADAEAIALQTELAEQAKLEAEEAKQSVAPLQAAIDADADEDEQIEAILSSVIYPEEVEPEDTEPSV